MGGCRPHRFVEITFRRKSNGLSAAVCGPASRESLGGPSPPSFLSLPMPSTPPPFPLSISSLQHLLLRARPPTLGLQGPPADPRISPYAPAASPTSGNVSPPPPSPPGVRQSPATCRHLRTVRGGRGRGAAPWGRSARPCCGHRSPPGPESAERAAGGRAAGRRCPWC